METVTALKSLDEAIADRLAKRAEAERQRLEAEAEQERLVEAGKEPFRLALAERIALDYGIDIRQESVEVQHGHTNGSDAAYNFRLVVKADDVDRVKIEAWVSQKWARSAGEIEHSKNRRDTVWVARRRGHFDGPDEQPVTLYYESNDLIDALIWAKSQG